MIIERVNKKEEERIIELGRKNIKIIEERWKRKKERRKMKYRQIC